MTSKQRRDLGIGKQRGRMRELIGELRDVDAGLHHVIMDERGVVVGVQRWCSESDAGQETGTGLGDYRTQGYTGLRGLSGKAGQRRLSAQRSSVVGAQYLMVYRTIGPERDDVQNGTSSITEGGY